MYSLVNTTALNCAHYKLRQSQWEMLCGRNSHISETSRLYKHFYSDDKFKPSSIDATNMHIGSVKRLRQVTKLLIRPQYGTITNYISPLIQRTSKADFEECTTEHRWYYLPTVSTVLKPQLTTVDLSPHSPLLAHADFINIPDNLDDPSITVDTCYYWEIVVFHQDYGAINLHMFYTDDDNGHLEISLSSKHNALSLSMHDFLQMCIQLSNYHLSKSCLTAIYNDPVPEKYPFTIALENQSPTLLQPWQLSPDPYIMPIDQPDYDFIQLMVLLAYLSFAKLLGSKATKELMNSYEQPPLPLPTENLVFLQPCRINGTNDDEK